MSDDAIKRALEVATRTACGNCDCSPVQPGCFAQVAEEVAAFLDAMNPHNRRAGFNLARDVEEAAAIRLAGGAA